MKRKKAIFFVLFGSDLGCVCVCVCVCAPALKKRVCLPWEKELPFLTVYTRKECAMKLTGLGFSLPLNEIDTTREYTWDGAVYRFLSTTCDGYVISVLSTEEILPEIQKLQPEELL